MPSRRRLAAAVACAMVVGVSAVPVVSAVSVDEPARVEYRAWRVDPPEYIADPVLRVQLEMVDLVNEVRADRALPGVELHDRVSAAAQVHAEYLASIRRSTHSGPGGTDTGFRLQQAGFDWITWGENVGAGFHDPAVLVERWLESPDHRRQLLGEYRHAGVGVAATPDGVPYWVLVLTS